MSSENQAVFPLSITFRKGRWTRSFISAPDVHDWATNELNNWAPYIQHSNLSQIVRSNRDQLQACGLSNAKTVEDIHEKLGRLSDSYLPFSAITELANTMGDAGQATIMAAEILSPGVVPWNAAPLLGPKIIALLFNAYGNPFALMSGIEAAQITAENIRGDYQAVQSQLQNLLIDNTKKFDDFYSTFSEKLALKEPRRYWQDRAKKHAEAAASDNKIWNRSLALICTATALLVVGGFKGFINFSIASDQIGVLVERLAVTGTLLGFVVWWLRQKLRDVRSHEHLAEDAEERTTMIDTYVTLRKAGLQDADMTPILTALYRPATTGLVDDGGPVLPLEILMKTATNAVKSQGA